MKLRTSSSKKWIVLLSLPFCVLGWSQESFSQPQQPKPLSQSVSNKPTFDWSWTKAQWKDNDNAFMHTRRALDKKAKDDQLTDALVQQYKDQATQGYKILDPLTQFRWAYAAYRLQILRHTPGQARMKGTLTALDRARDSKGTRQLSYNYSRLLYLNYMMDGLAFSPLKVVGERLLKVNPNDYEVKFFQIQLLNTRVAKDNALYQRYIADLQKQNPRDPALQSAIASREFKNWLITTKNKKDGLRAIQQYRKLVKMPEANAATRKFALERISTVEQRLDRFEQKRLKKAQKG